MREYAHSCLICFLAGAQASKVRCYPDFEWESRGVGIVCALGAAHLFSLQPCLDPLVATYQTAGGGDEPHQASVQLASGI